MKKVLLSLMVMGAFNFAAVAQQVVSQDRALKPAQKDFVVPARLAKKAAVGTTGVFDTRAALEAQNISVSPFISTLFPDTLVKVQYAQNTVGRPGYHSIGMVLDPAMSIYSLGNPFPAALKDHNSYVVDSVHFVYSYQRHNPDPNIVDTLIMTIHTDSIFVVELDGRDFTLADLRYNPTTNEARGVTPGHRYVRLLTTADTTSGYGTLDFYTNLARNGGSILAVAFTFKPGYTYSEGDTLDPVIAVSGSVMNPLNHFEFQYFEDNGATNEAPKTLAIADRKFNNGLIAYTDIRYNKDTKGWNGQYYPGFYTKTTSGQTFMAYPRVLFTITAEKVGFEDLTADGFGLGDVYPNPATSDVTFEFANGNDANVNITLYNAVGQAVKTIASGEFATGKHSVDANISDLKSGVYFYTMTSGSYSKTAKLVISK